MQLSNISYSRMIFELLIAGSDNQENHQLEMEKAVEQMQLFLSGNQNPFNFQLEKQMEYCFKNRITVDSIFKFLLQIERNEFSTQIWKHQQPNIDGSNQMQKIEKQFVQLLQINQEQQIFNGMNMHNEDALWRLFIIEPNFLVNVKYSVDLENIYRAIGKIKEIDQVQSGITLLIDIFKINLCQQQQSKQLCDYLSINIQLILPIIFELKQLFNNDSQQTILILFLLSLIEQSKKYSEFQDLIIQDAEILDQVVQMALTQSIASFQQNQVSLYFILIKLKYCNCNIENYLTQLLTQNRNLILETLLYFGQQNDYQSFIIIHMMEMLLIKLLLIDPFIFVDLHSDVKQIAQRINIKYQTMNNPLYPYIPETIIINTLIIQALCFNFVQQVEQDDILQFFMIQIQNNNPQDSEINSAILHGMKLMILNSQLTNRFQFEKIHLQLGKYFDNANTNYLVLEVIQLMIEKGINISTQIQSYLIQERTDYLMEMMQLSVIKSLSQSKHLELIKNIFLYIIHLLKRSKQNKIFNNAEICLKSTLLQIDCYEAFYHLSYKLDLNQSSIYYFDELCEEIRSSFQNWTILQQDSSILSLNNKYLKVYEILIQSLEQLIEPKSKQTIKELLQTIYFILYSKYNLFHNKLEIQIHLESRVSKFKSKILWLPLYFSYNQVRQLIGLGINQNFSLSIEESELLKPCTAILFENAKEIRVLEMNPMIRIVVDEQNIQQSHEQDVQQCIRCGRKGLHHLQLYVCGACEQKIEFQSATQISFKMTQSVHGTPSKFSPNSFSRRLDFEQSRVLGSPFSGK